MEGSNPRPLRTRTAFEAGSPPRGIHLPFEVGTAGFEPANACTQSRWTTGLSHAPKALRQWGSLDVFMGAPAHITVKGVRTPGVNVVQLSFAVVQPEGVEPSRLLRHEHLKLACLPFHHGCMVARGYRRFSGSASEADPDRGNRTRISGFSGRRCTNQLAYEPRSTACPRGGDRSGDEQPRCAERDLNPHDLMVARF